LGVLMAARSPMPDFRLPVYESSDWLDLMERVPDPAKTRTIIIWSSAGGYRIAWDERQVAVWAPTHEEAAGRLALNVGAVRRQARAQG
jgi:hypothetical protein